MRTKTRDRSAIEQNDTRLDILDLQKDEMELDCFVSPNKLLLLSVPTNMGINRFKTSAWMVRSGQVWHFYSLGGVFSSQLWQ